MSRFWELLQQSIIVQSAITIGLVATACAIWLQGQNLPQDLQQIMTIVVAYWMGTKAQHAIERASKAAKEPHDL